MRALGVDYGRRRIGLALSDATGLLARPWKTVAREGGPEEVAAMLGREVAALASESDGLVAVVLGFPRRLSGEPNAQTATVEAVAVQLRAIVRLPVVLQDERLTSREADRQLALREKDWRKRKPLLDAASAAILLQDYLDGQARPAPGIFQDDVQDEVQDERHDVDDPDPGVGHS